MAFFAIVLIFKSCSSDDNDLDDQVTAADIEMIKAAVGTGEWKITRYADDENEETSDYTGFVFSFNSNGVLVATDGNTALSGAWSVTDSEKSDDDVDFNLFFAAPDAFEELSDDWDIQKYSNTKIELVDVSGGDGGTDHLTFEKI